MAKHYGLHAKYTDAEAVLALYGNEGICWQTFFESIDGFLLGKSGDGSAECGRNALKIQTGALTNNYTYLWKNPDYPCFTPSWDKKRRLHIGGLNIKNAVTACEVWAVVGATEPWGVGEYHIGFKVVNGAIYGTVGDGTDESTLDLEHTLEDLNERANLEAILTPGVECRFFDNYVDKGALTTNLPSGILQADQLFWAYVKTTEDVIKYLSIAEWRFLQEP